MRDMNKQRMMDFVRSSRYKLAFALLACLALSVSAAAQQRISGTVTDNQNHSPVKSATVKLEGGLFTMPSETTTDADGHFSFAGLSPNRYTLSLARARTPAHGGGVAPRSAPAQQASEWEPRPR